ncbi:MAG: phosphate ABC transporter substrate-binding protein [Proteobacteria bacterium]|nr:phosphate ABC transporter substrate-binding protein [Pseudomonadota bacterium]
MKTKTVVGLIALMLMITANQVFAWDWPWARKKKANTITLTGSTTVLPIAQRAAETFMEIRPKANISVRGGGSGVGIAALIDGTADIASASRPMKTKEVKTAREKGVNPVETIIARDGIAIIVHPENPINELSLVQLKDIYTGEIAGWDEVGGESKTIVVVSRDVASGTFEVFKKLILKGGKAKDDALMLASNRAVAATVEQAPGAIGYVGLGYISTDVKVLKMEGGLPSLEAVAKGEYKLARPLFMYTNGKPKGLAKEFIDFILSPQGQGIVKDLGFVPVK